nr:hypothetical protein [Tanacetum cinerariifolium]
MIKENVDVFIAAERAKQANVKNDASGSRPVRGQDTAPVVRECTFAEFMKCNPTIFHGIKGAIELRRWFKKIESIFGINECAEGKKTVNQMPWTEMKQLMTVEFCPIKEVQRMEHELWNLKNNQKQGKARAMVTAPTNEKVSFGSLTLCERCFTRHVGPCTIKCHKGGKIEHKARYCKEKNVATGANTLPIPTCYDCGEQGHTRNQCPKKVKQEEVEEVRGRAYAIKRAEPSSNVVTGTFLLNNHYDFVLFDLCSDMSFVDTRFSSMLNIDPVKIGASYEVELADGR